MLRPGQLNLGFQSAVVRATRSLLRVGGRCLIQVPIELLRVNLLLILPALWQGQNSKDCRRYVSLLTVVPTSHVAGANLSLKYTKEPLMSKFITIYVTFGARRVSANVICQLRRIQGPIITRTYGGS